MPRVRLGAGKKMIDLDTLHAVFQFPVAAVELTVAAAMISRYYWATHAAERPSIDPAVTILLALFLLVIAIKQAFWSIWGAIQASDMLNVAEVVRTHYWPIINNALITAVGLVLIGRLVGVYIGARAYVGAGAVGAVLFGIGAAVVVRGW